MCVYPAIDAHLLSARRLLRHGDEAPAVSENVHEMRSRMCARSSHTYLMVTSAQSYYEQIIARSRRVTITQLKALSLISNWGEGANPVTATAQA